MRLFGIGTARNEADVIGESIEHALLYCDRVIYLDNASDDDTWEIIEEKARDHPGRVVAFGRLDIPYVEGIRSVIYNEFHSGLDEGDWWMKLDADEFIHHDPRPVVEDAVRVGADVVRAWHAQFYFTDLDALRWERGEEDLDEPVTRRRRFYRANWRQVHLWRNVVDAPWTDLSRSIPEQRHRIHRRAVVNRHYQFRDPLQISRRLAARVDLDEFPHVTDTDWRSVVRSAAACRRWEDGRPIRLDRAFYYRLRLRQETEAAFRRRPLRG